ncbi:MAG: IPT/TIG domain-containing protein [Aeromicrobium sp.]
MVTGAVALVASPTTQLFSDPAPLVRTLSSDSGPVAGGTEVVITGSGFTARPVVTFGGQRAEVRRSSPSQIVVDVPASDAGSVNVHVRTADGSSRAAANAQFTYVAPPTVTEISPTQGSTKGGTKVTITGTDFVDGTTVRFGKTEASDVKVTSPTTLTATTPSKGYGIVNAYVTTPFGESDKTKDTKFRMGSDGQLKLRVGSFNVRVASGYAKMRSSKLERPWTTRLPVVANQITREGLDVVGIQEASASGKYTRTGRSQFHDIVAALGSPYQLTNSERYCSGAGAGGRCANGGSSSDRIIYNTDRLKLLGQGSRKLDGRGAGDGSGRYVGWARFRDLRSDEEFLFVNTHLEPGKVSGTRLRQARIILNEIAAVNAENLPTIMVGDLAAGKFDKLSPHNAAHGAFTSAGFVDPLVNTRGYGGTAAPVAEQINTRYSSLNYFRAAPQTLGTPIGSYLDYILVRGKGIDLLEWKTVVDLDGAGRFAGVIPSDHNLVRLTMVLPITP